MKERRNVLNQLDARQARPFLNRLRKDDPRWRWHPHLMFHLRICWACGSGDPELLGQLERNLCAGTRALRRIEEHDLKASPGAAVEMLKEESTYWAWCGGRCECGAAHDRGGARKLESEGKIQ